MKNPIANLLTAATTWSRLRQWPGLFRLGDAALQMDRVLLPARFAYRAAGRELQARARWQREPDGAYRVTLPNDGGLTFFWPTAPEPNLWFLIEQELTAGNPHYYTTPPIAIGPDSRVLDVGACEGLFAFRCLRNGLAREVIAFEPSPTMGALLRRGAEANGVHRALRVVPSAVGAETGTVIFDTAPGAEAGRIDAANPGGARVPCTRLDDFCREARLDLTRRDLLKIDAEGADFDVLRGAEQLIRSGAPQIAVTTYHCDEHAEAITRWLKAVQPAYRLRLKGFSFWTPHPRPLLLLAAAD